MLSRIRVRKTIANYKLQGNPKDFFADIFVLFYFNAKERINNHLSNITSINSN